MCDLRRLFVASVMKCSVVAKGVRGVEGLVETQTPLHVLRGLSDAGPGWAGEAGVGVVGGGSVDLHMRLHSSLSPLTSSHRVLSWGWSLRRPRSRPLVPKGFRQALTCEGGGAK
jgi:hypothetical protein